MGPPAGRVVSFLHKVFVWFNDPANWQGDNGILNRLQEHLILSVGALVIACAIAVPTGVLLGRSRRKGSVAVNLANVGRAIPSFAVIALGVIWLRIGATPTLIALVVLAIPPVFTFCFTAIRQVDGATVDAARGMGMPEARLLRHVQLPMARPLMLQGIRLSSSAILATATLAALVGWGGLGRYIVDGFSVRDYVEVTAGVILVAALVILNEIIFALVIRFTTSPGLRLQQSSGRTRRSRARRGPRWAIGSTPPDVSVQSERAVAPFGGRGES